MKCRIAEVHCENCGGIGPENLGNAETEGYTQCCNELETSAADCRGHHLEEES